MGIAPAMLRQSPFEFRVVSRLLTSPPASLPRNLVLSGRIGARSLGRILKVADLTPLPFNACPTGGYMGIGTSRGKVDVWTE